jgi:hypothetical protein
LCWAIMRTRKRMRKKVPFYIDQGKSHFLKDRSSRVNAKWTGFLFVYTKCIFYLYWSKKNRFLPAF